MIDTAISFENVSEVIQLALAPAFLLTGIAGMLNVMTGRLSRIIDRGRLLADLPTKPDPIISIERANLEKRRSLASAAITYCTLSALLVCLVIVVLFVKPLLGLEMNWLVGALFTISMVSLVMGLGYFLREVHRATKTVRILSK